ncbi:hypothetical protein BDV33DRAFT_210545 [Aspergillus novoparasiticus]|uniref:Uncharacterized protein n=1 Tax=Aspergillus novoparasiticus TaxID=986946 RepID=A0A5N6E707_9EURO|nr:hypothetical protein BDV33DRAFT_210545 [Aspergillus novoparasiticus]
MPRDIEGRPSITYYQGTWSKESYNGIIRTEEDALLLCDASIQGILPMLTRPLPSERNIRISPGSIFIWDEHRLGVSSLKDGHRIHLVNYFDNSNTSKNGFTQPTQDPILLRSSQQLKRVTIQKNANSHFTQIGHIEDLCAKLLNVTQRSQCDIDDMFQSSTRYPIRGALSKLDLVAGRTTTDHENSQNYLPNHSADLKSALDSSRKDAQASNNAYRTIKDAALLRKIDSQFFNS